MALRRCEISSFAASINGKVMPTKLFFWRFTVNVTCDSGICLAKSRVTTSGGDDATGTSGTVVVRGASDAISVSLGAGVPVVAADSVKGSGRTFRAATAGCSGSTFVATTVPASGLSVGFPAGLTTGRLAPSAGWDSGAGTDAIRTSAIESAVESVAVSAGGKITGSNSDSLPDSAVTGVAISK